MVEGDLTIDGLTRWLLPGLADAFGYGDKITLLTGNLFYRHEPMLAFNVTRGTIVRAESWRLWALTVAPAVLLLPLLRPLGIFVTLGLPLLVFGIAGLRDLELRRAEARLERDREGEAAIPRARPANPTLIDRLIAADEPEPDRDHVLLDRWNGDFGPGYRRDMGALALPDGRLLVGEPGALAHAIEMDVPPGSYPVWLAMLEEDGFGRVSHAFLALGEGRATRVVPVPAADGSATELGVDGGLAAFAPSGAPASLAAASGGRAERDHLLVKALLDARAGWLRFAVPGSNDVIAAFTSGEGDGLYPLVTLQDDAGTLLAVALDFRLW